MTQGDKDKRAHPAQGKSVKSYFVCLYKIRYTYYMKSYTTKGSVLDDLGFDAAETENLKSSADACD